MGLMKLWCRTSVDLAATSILFAAGISRPPVSAVRGQSCANMFRSGGETASQLARVGETARTSLSFLTRHRTSGSNTGAYCAAQGLGSIAVFGEGQQVIYDQLSAAQKLRLAQGATLALAWREMHEADVARCFLPPRPVERKIIEIVAEIGSRRAGGDGGKALRP